MSINSIGASLSIGSLSGGTTTFSSTVQFQHGSQWNQFYRSGTAIGNLNKYTDQDGVSMFGLWHQDAVGTPYSGINTDDKASANSGGIKLRTGDATAGSYNSGEILIKTGASAGGTRGRVKLDGSYIDASSAKISNVASPDASSDAATKGYADAEILVEKNRAIGVENGHNSRITALESASVEFIQEKFVLSASDVSNGYIELANLAIQSSINAYVDRLAIHETDDYTVSVVNGKTRITFCGDLVDPSPEQVAEGDVIRVKYAKRAIV